MSKAIQIQGYPGYYITDNGDVYSCNYKRTGLIKQLKPRNKFGYKAIELCKDGQKHSLFIHRLLAKAFIPNPEHKPQINHIDGNKQNNVLSNLEWCTQSENTKHAYNVLKIPKANLGKIGKDCPLSKLVLQIKDGRVVAEFFGTKEAMRKTGVNFRNISNVCLGKRKTAGGYQWKYK